ncbi:MAG TPA: Sir2 family NAD-dependent protein deacetylase [Terrimesophilobacter sp.]|nr:Sir2 family NAD-dependent protein deacetylase [Terrimesophilobacter sp.]
MQAVEKSAVEVQGAVDALRGRSIAVLTGAGVSTDSGIPDYRGEGAPVRNPMTLQQFLADDAHRRRYWAGSHLGWRRFAGIHPNPGHLALAAMERAGRVTGVLTQNVDGLHRRAGSQRVVELHGAMGQVRCLNCGQLFARQEIAARLSAANPWIDDTEEVELAPDGDVATDRLDGFVIPECTVCGGTLKPDVVFFGELIPSDRFHAAAALVRQAEALLIAGSSLVVNSGIRLLDIAVKRRIPVVIVNRGPTKGDARATVRLEAGTSETLAALAKSL